MPVGRARTTLLTGLVCVVLATAGSLAPPAVAEHPRAGHASVVTRWNEVAERTITAGEPRIPVSTLFYGYVSLAVHDAVTAASTPRRGHSSLSGAGGRASVDAAVATAAHDVLRHYFRTAAPALAVDLAETLETIPRGRARLRGQQIGAAAAARLIASRPVSALGRRVPVPMPAPGPAGVWEPPPTGMLAPWLGFLRPLVASLEQVRQPGPDALTSAAYARDFREVKTTGSADDVTTPEGRARERIARFHNADVVRQHQSAMRAAVTQRRMTAREAARAFAVLGASQADAAVACWWEKHTHAFWRPVAAIARAGEDGNPGTTPQPGWRPRIGTPPGTPPYPDYTSGHACATGAATGTHAALFGERRSEITLTAPATGEVRHYRTAAALDREAMDARIWLGLHFRKAMTDGNALGHEVAAQVAEELSDRTC